MSTCHATSRNCPLAGQRDQTRSVPMHQTEFTMPAEPHSTVTARIRTKNNMGTSEWSERQQTTTKQVRIGAR